MSTRIEFGKVVCLQLANILLHYIDHPIDILLITKYLKQNTSPSLIASSICLFLLPNLVSTLFSVVFNIGRLSLGKLTVIALMLGLNLDPLVSCLVYVGFSRKKLKKSTKHCNNRLEFINIELKNLEYIYLISSLLRSVLNGYPLSMLLFYKEYKLLLLGLDGSGKCVSSKFHIKLEFLKIGISIFKFSINSSRLAFHLMTNEFGLDVNRTGFYAAKIVSTGVYLCTRCFLLVILLANADLKLIFISICILRFLLVDFLYTFYNLTTHRSLINSLTLFWSMFIALLKQTGCFVATDLVQFMVVATEALVLYVAACMVLLRVVAEQTQARQMWCVVYVFVSVGVGFLLVVSVEVACVRAIATTNAGITRPVILEKFREWIWQQSGARRGDLGEVILAEIGETKALKGDSSSPMPLASESLRLVKVRV